MPSSLVLGGSGTSRTVTVTPNAAFYAFPDISAHFGKTSPAGTRITSAQSFADALLDEALG